MSSLRQMPSVHRLREFVEDVLAPGPAIGTIVGEIRGDTYHLSAFGSEIALSTVTIDSDEQGRFALVEGGDLTLPNGMFVALTWDTAEEATTLMAICTPADPKKSGVFETPPAWSLYFWLDGTLEAAHPTVPERAAGG